MHGEDVGLFEKKNCSLISFSVSLWLNSIQNPTLRFLPLLTYSLDHNLESKVFYAKTKFDN